MEREVAELYFSLHLTVPKRIVPTAGKERKGPGGGAKARKPRRKIPGGLAGFAGNGRVGALARKVEPFDGFAIIVQYVVHPAELQHDRKVHGIVFMRDGQILQRILEITG